jgi:cytidylate kinase
MRAAEDAVELDTTERRVDEVVAQIVGLANERGIR